MEVGRTAGIQRTKTSQRAAWYGSYMYVVDLVVLRSGVGIDVGGRFSRGIMDLNSASRSARIGTDKRKILDRVMHSDAPAALIGKSIPQATVACPTRSQYRIESDRSS